MWDYPTMTVKVDSKRRVVVPGVKPGEVFACEQQDENHILLVRLARPPLPAKKSRAEVRKALQNSKLKFESSWEELRTATRES